MQRIQLDAPEPIWLDDPKAVAGVVRGLRESKAPVALDTETTGLDITRDVPLYISLATPEIRVVLEAQNAEPLRELLQDEDAILVAHNWKFDAHMMANIGIPIRAKAHDTLVKAGMSDSSRSSLKLKDLGVSLYGADDPASIRYGDFASIFGRPGKGETAGDLLKKAPRQLVVDYVANDSWLTARIDRTLNTQLQRITNWRGMTLWDLFVQVEEPFTHLLWDIERQGVKIDVAKLEQLKVEWTRRIEELEKEFASIAGRPINLSSPSQLRQYFLLDKGLTTNQFTNGGESGEMRQSTGKASLALWAEQGIPEAKILQQYRELRLLRSTFVEGLLSKRDANDRVHGTFNQVGTETGRLSSTDPNLQNIPTRTDQGKRIRECFIAEDGNVLGVRDYDQLEMRLAAAISGDPVMIKIIREGKDIHSGNAAIAFDVPYEAIMEAIAAKEAKQQLTDEQKQLLVFRFRAKTIGFGTLYGEGLLKLAGQLGFDISTDEARKKAITEARKIRDRFFSSFHVLLADVQRTHRLVEKDLFVQTLMGRIRALPAAALRDTPAYFKALRQAYNTRIQGTAADIAKLAMLRIWRDPDIRREGGRLLLQVHDELMVEMPKLTSQSVFERMGRHMQESYQDMGVRLPVPLTSGGGIASNWAEAKQ
ncbi:MAG: hypothetical protein GYA36_19690 [Veillonellaceae bacterium]|nr:hypothetical protein [Veillonellaceae bacterium]